MVRECGTCHACCVSIRVVPEPGDAVEVTKAAHVRCPKLTPEGRCGIYAQRPGGCSAFRCSWLAGLGEEDERPDRCGAIVELGEGIGNNLMIALPTPAPGYANHSRSYRDTLKRWRARGAIVLDGSAKPLERLAELGAVLRLASGEEIDFRRRRITRP